MDKQDIRVKMAAKLLLDYLLEHREALKVMIEHMDQQCAGQQTGKEETTPPEPIRSAQ